MAIMNENNYRNAMGIFVPKNWEKREKWRLL